MSLAMEIDAPSRKSATETPICSPFVRGLIDALNEAGLPYCHWKSNYSLANAFAGVEDLDLLVDRSKFPILLALLAERGFKQAVVRRGLNPAAISHYYGHDPDTGHLVHVHLFSRILTGESFVKGHLLPFEEMLLAGHADFHGLRVAPRAAELALFLVRNFVKYGSPVDLVYQVKGAEKLRGEIQWLLDGCEIRDALALAARYCPVVPESLWHECIAAIRDDAPLWRRILLARRMRRAVRPYAVLGRGERLRAYAGLLTGKLLRYVRRGGKNKRFAEGGAIIAFVGPEATGKSTLVANCRDWLGEAVATRDIHAGKPPSSWLTAPVNVFLPLLRRLLPEMRTSRVEGHVATSPGKQAAADSDETGKGTGSLAFALRSVAVAWDRRRLLLWARRRAASGEIVVCDRYPSEVVGAMDSPRLKPKAGNGWRTRLFNALVAWEGAIYRQIPPPDAVFLLKVSVETAKIRNRERIKPGKETDEYLESRHRMAGGWRRAGTRSTVEISTEGTLDDSICRMKAAVWNSL